MVDAILNNPRVTLVPQSRQSFLSKKASLPSCVGSSEPSFLYSDRVKTYDYN